MKATFVLAGGLMVSLAAALQLQAGAAQGEPVVPVARPAERTITDYADYNGRVAARDFVTIVPRVTGYLIKALFKEGAAVKKGELLFEIDPTPYQAALETAKAQLVLAEATLKYAKASHERMSNLAKANKGVVSEQELDQQLALREEAAFRVLLARTKLDETRLKLEWTKVVSPIDGIVSRYNVSIGNLVKEDVTPLTSVVSMSPVYVYFEMDEPTLLRIKRAINDGKINPAKEPLPLLMGLPGEAGYSYKGTVDFVDNQVKPKTGGIAVRGVFANPTPPKGTPLLVHGMSVQVRLPMGPPHSALLVVEGAIQKGKGEKYVYVVNSDNKVIKRTVTLGPLQEDGLRVIQQGLEKDDRVVVGGLQQIVPGATVKPDLITMPTLLPPASSGKGEAKDAPKEQRSQLPGPRLDGY